MPIMEAALAAVGFGHMGPVAGSAAAWVQSVYWGGAVAAGSWFAYFQSLGMTTEAALAAAKAAAAAGAAL